MTGPAPAVAATRVAVRPCLRALAGRTAVVAVSGGADSLALLAAAIFEARRVDVTVLAVTVDHGLQPGSAERAASVVELAQRAGVHAEAVRVTVPPTGAGGPEAAARDARYAALRERAQAGEAAGILLGHTLDDQAETVLLGLARGSGGRSLAGMAAESGLLRRPFLGLRRAETRAACAAQGLTPWDDPMNADPAYTRVRVRTDLLPAFEAALGPGVAEALGRTAALLADDADALDLWAAQALAECHDELGGLSVEALTALPAAVRTRVVKAAAAASGAPALTSAHLRALEQLVIDWHGQGAVGLPGAWVGERACGRLTLRPPALPPPAQLPPDG